MNCTLAPHATCLFQVIESGKRICVREQKDCAYQQPVQRGTR